MTRSLLLLLSPFAVFAQQNVSVKGRLPELAGHEVYLEDAKHFRQLIKIDKQGNFALNARIDSGYYFIDKELSLYLSPGMNFSVEGKSGNLQLLGKGADENKLLTKIDLLSKKYFPEEGKDLHAQFNDIEPEEFITITDQFREEANAAVEKSSPNLSFIKTQKKHVDYLIKYYTHEYVQRYGISKEKEAEYYKLAQNLRPGADATEVLFPAVNAMHTKKLPVEKAAQLQALVWEDFDLNDAVLYSFSKQYRKLVSTRIECLRTAELIRSPYLKSKNQFEQRRDIVKQELKDGPVRDELLYQNTLNLINGSAEDEKFLNDYVSLSKDSVYKNNLIKRFEKLKLVNPGNDAPQFAYRDQRNKLVTSDDLKGNYVYINIWSSALNASLQEIPFLKIIEKKYQNQNIRFVNISVDIPEMKERWLKYVHTQYPSGTHLISDRDSRSEFIQAFGVNTFPRYILINPEGKIVLSNAPRPSSAKLQDTLDKILFNNLSTCATCATKKEY